MLILRIIINVATLRFLSTYSYDETSAVYFRFGAGL